MEVDADRLAQAIFGNKTSSQGGYNLSFLKLIYANQTGKDTKSADRDQIVQGLKEHFGSSLPAPTTSASPYRNNRHLPSCRSCPSYQKELEDCRAEKERLQKLLATSRESKISRAPKLPIFPPAPPLPQETRETQVIQQQPRVVTPAPKATPKAFPKTTPKASPKATPKASPRATPKASSSAPQAKSFLDSIRERGHRPVSLQRIEQKISGLRQPKNIHGIEVALKAKFKKQKQAQQEQKEQQQQQWN